MPDWFLSLIDWEMLGKHDRADFHIRMEDITLQEEQKTLEIVLSVNFLMPLRAEQKIRANILHRLPELNTVTFIYRHRDIIQTEEEIARILLVRVIAENPSAKSLLASVDGERSTLEGDSFHVSTVGGFAQERLRAEIAPALKARLQEYLHRPVEILFQLDEERYDVLGEKLRIAGEAVVPAQALNQAKEKSMRADRKGDARVKTGAGEVRRRRSSDKAAPGMILGARKIPHDKDKLLDLVKLREDSGTVLLGGIVFDTELKNLKNGKRCLYSIMLTDKVSSTIVKAFVGEERAQAMSAEIGIGDYLYVRGTAGYDSFARNISVLATDIEKGNMPRRKDEIEGPHRVELHCHTKMSMMDGLNEPRDIVERAVYWHQKAVAITDHGVVQSFPEAARLKQKYAADKEDPRDIKILYGMEGYLIEDNGAYERGESFDYKKMPYYHIILLCSTQCGIQNLYKMVSLSHMKYFYKKPLLPRSMIEHFREGIILGSACEAGEVYRAVVAGKSDAELDKIASFYDYLEIQPLINNRFMITTGKAKNEEDIRIFNRRVVSAGKRLGKPVCATTDAHYASASDAIFRNVIQAGMNFKDSGGGQGLYLRTTQEMLDEFSYLGKDLAYEVVVTNTNKIADEIADDILPVPTGKFPPKIEGAEEELMTSCMERAHAIYGDPLPPEIEERLNKELHSIIGNGYAVMYVSAQMLVRKSNQDGYLVGSRGSVGSSFAATMAGITEVNPLDTHYICPSCKHFEWGNRAKYSCGVDMPPKKCPVCGTEMRRDGFTIPFATFLGFDGDKEPDIDLNFAGEYQPIAHAYVGEIFGEKNVYKAGTVSTVKDRTAEGFVRKFAGESRFPLSDLEVQRLATGCAGVKRTTGQHPGGIIIVPEGHEIYEFCPVQYPANDSTKGATTHFDYHKIENNLLKLDILGHNYPSMARQLHDITGIDPLSIHLTDPDTMAIFNGTETLGIRDPEYKYTDGSYTVPEFGTNFVRKMLNEIHPKTFSDLVKIAGLSHGTDVWKNNAEDYIQSGTATIDEIISTRDDIMNYLISKGVENKLSFQIMETVRKNRPMKEEQIAAMKEHGVPDWYIDSCIKVQYLFPRAHAVAYAMMSFRMAWFKVHRPVAYYATYFTTEIEDFDADVILAGKESCYRHAAAAASIPGGGNAKEKAAGLVFEAAYEMYARGIELLRPVLGESSALRFSVKDGKILLPYQALKGVGASAALAIEKAYKDGPFTTMEDLTNRTGINKTALQALRESGVLEGMAETNQLSFF